MLFNKYNLNLTERGFNIGFTLNQLEQERQIKKLQKKEDQDTKDYEKLDNLPKINNVELKGNKTTRDLGINADNVMLSDGVTSVESALGTEKKIKEVTADGVKTYKDLLLELYTSANSYTGFAQLRIDTAYFSPTSKVSFSRISYSSNTFHAETIGIGSTNATYHKGDMTTSGTWAYTNMSETVPSSGTKIGLYKCN